MKSVFLYLCSGTFAGNQELDYNHPSEEANYKFLLFLYQAEQVPSELKAKAEAAKFGFASCSIENAKPLSIESINTDTYQKFSSYYEEAIAEGSALAWYPNH